MDQRLLVITPVHNEAGHIERTARAVAAQARPPDLWIVVDDGSDDDTLEILSRLESQIAFLRVLRAPQGRRDQPLRDRLAVAKEAVAFNWALTHVTLQHYTHVGKLDGDVELPPEWYSSLLRRFATDPRLGLAGGTLVEQGPEGWSPVKIPVYHVHGAVKLFSRECFLAIGGIQERLGWDTIDETYARMHGWVSRSSGDLVARHHRASGSADGRLRGHARHGECAYIVCYGLWWVLLRSLKMARRPPLGLSGVAFVGGYVRAAARRADRVEDPAYRRFVRRELRRRLVQPSGRFAVLGERPRRAAEERRAAQRSPLRWSSASISASSPWPPAGATGSSCADCGRHSKATTWRT
jgi:poly-beta-1,6-N-acetyl-D-glucosamine synthase